jgi:hypothetical protein
MGINGVDAITFNSWALSVIRQATSEKAFFKYRELPEFVEKIKFSNGILGALSQFVNQQVRDVDAAISREFLTNEKLFKLWKESHSKAIQPRLKDFKHDVGESNLSIKEKQVALDYVQNLLADQEDYVGDLYKLLSDEKLLGSFLPADPKLGEHLSYLSRMVDNNRRKKHLD